MMEYHNATLLIREMSARLTKGAHIRVEGQHRRF